MKKLLNYLHNDLYLEVICLIFLILSFCFEPFDEVFQGYLKILTHPSILVTDYLAIGGVGASFLNASLTLIYTMVILKLCNVKTSGPIYCGYLMTLGFGFWGENILNVTPIYLGIYLFSKYKKTHLRSFAITFVFSSGIAPIVSYCMFGYGIPLYFGIPLGIIVGIIVGFILPGNASHTLAFSEGYNIYNVGFTLGIISSIFNGFLIVLGLKAETLNIYYGDKSLVLYIILFVLSLLMLVVPLLTNKDVLKEYSMLCKTSGRLISDYVRSYSVETVIFNTGILLGLCSLIFVVFGIEMNGAIFGTIIAMSGIASFGVHLRNVVPVWIGAGIVIFIKLICRNDISINMSTDLGMLVAFILSVAIAPIGGKYGFVYGLLGGGMHIALTPLLVSVQGGFDLYNNGFSGGFEAAVLATLAEKISNRGDSGLHVKQGKDK